MCAIFSLDSCPSIDSGLRTLRAEATDAKVLVNAKCSDVIIVVAMDY